MRPLDPVTWGMVAAGLLIGGWAGHQRFDQAFSPETECASCHVNEDLAALSERESPHTTNYFSVCHSCHVLTPGAYVAGSLGSLGLEAPAWARQIEDPIVGGQDCMECHRRIGQPEIDCALCHEEPGEAPQQVANCQTCHQERMPVEPHDGVSCVACHIEAIANPREMAKMRLSAEEQKREFMRHRAGQRAGISMQTKDQVTFRGEQVQAP